MGKIFTYVRMCLSEEVSREYIRGENLSVLYLQSVIGEVKKPSSIYMGNLCNVKFKFKKFQFSISEISTFVFQKSLKCNIFNLRMNELLSCSSPKKAT